jgi:hypothetical protein
MATAFARDESFGFAIKAAFEFFMNHTGGLPGTVVAGSGGGSGGGGGGIASASRVAEALAKFMDARLRSGGQGAKGAGGEAGVEALLDAVLGLFRHLSAKVRGGSCCGRRHSKPTSQLGGQPAS